MTDFERMLTGMSDEEFFRKVDEPEVFDPETTELSNKPTPNGGAYSRAFYYDAQRCPCRKELAYYANIVEYDKNDNRINETYSVLRDVTGSNETS